MVAAVLALNMAAVLGAVKLQPPPLRGLLGGLLFLAVAVAGTADAITRHRLTSMRARAGGRAFTPLAVAALRELRVQPLQPAV